MYEDLPGVESHFIDLPALRMHYVTSGPANGNPVVLLHGFPEFWYCWRFQIPALAQAGYRVIVPDQRGYNLTEKQGPYTLATLTEDIRQLLDALRVDGCDVVAHDFGAPPAYTYAWLYGSRVKKLVIMNGPHPNAFLDALWRHPSQLLRSWYILFFQLPWLPEFLFRAGGFAGLRKAFAEVSRNSMSAVDFERFDEAFAQPGALKATIGWYRASMRRLLHGPPAIRAIRVPTCVIWGAKDRELGKHVNDTLETYVADLRLHSIADAGHFVQMDAPAEVNRILIDFLDGSES